MIKQKWRYLLILLAISCSCNKEEEKQKEIVLEDDQIVTIGIYAGNGAAEGCVIAAEKMFQWMNYTTRRIIATDINNSKVSAIDIFYFPGGSSGPYRSDISSSGKELIKSMVASGCGFIGTCAGALFACESQNWEGYFMTSGQLGLFKGTGTGPNPEIYAYPEIGMCKINLDITHSITVSLPDTSWIMFYNGPYFDVHQNTAETQVVGRYQKTGKPALLACKYGKGKVFLTGPHPEWEEDDNRDGVSYFKEYDDKGSDWDLMKKATEWCLNPDQ